MRSAFALRINSGKNIFMFAPLENLRIFQRGFFKRGGVAGNFPAMPKVTPSGSLRSPAPPRGRLCAMPKTFPPLPKAVPLGKVASPQAMTEGESPQRRAFAESGAANAAALHDPTCEKGIQKRPQAFLNPELKIIFPLKMARAQQRRPPPAVETGRSCWGSGQRDARAAQGTMRMLGAATR